MLNEFDPFSSLRNGLRKIAEMRGEWAGIPMPLEGEKLIIEPHFSKGKELSEIGATEPESGNGETLRNTFWSTRHRCNIMIWKESDGRIDWGKCGRGHHFDHDLKTLMCSNSWGIEQESNAVNTLGTLLRHHQFRQYMLTGMFMETSKRSMVTYLFRRLKPTVALRAEGERVRILAALCMHPIAYYEGSWAGAMCPTDDVIAHLMLMRGDEKMYWRQSNQHGASRPEAGL